MNIPDDFTQENINQFPLAFIFATIYRQYNMYLKRVLASYEITASEFPVIMTLYKQDKKQTQQDIAKTFYLTEGSIARTVRNLEDKHIIKREIDDNNRRRNFVYLTKKGRMLAEEVFSFDSIWEDEVCDFLDEDKMDRFKQILYKLTINSINAK